VSECVCVCMPLVSNTNVIFVYINIIPYQGQYSCEPAVGVAIYPYEPAVGVAIYPLAARLNHSCVPNASGEP
jgi:hypothetical protein